MIRRLTHELEAEFIVFISYRQCEIQVVKFQLYPFLLTHTPSPLPWQWRIIKSKK
jgi:hypothetical protein